MMKINQRVIYLVSGVVVCLVIALGLPQSGWGFSGCHPQITKAALALIATSQTVSALADQSNIGDQGEANKLSASHYDNCCWYQGQEWIIKHRGEALDYAYNYYCKNDAVNYLKVFQSLGYVVHATEDFYAHSNWIENNAWGVLADLDGAPPGFWLSGTWPTSIPNPAPPGTPSHNEISKDTDGASGFLEARGDAVLAVQDQIRLFRAALYAKYPNQAKAIFKKLGFRDVPARYIGATVNWPSGRIYFFIGNQYYRYDLNGQDRVDPGYPRPIAGNWPGLEPFAGGIDAGFVTSDGKKAYFFRKDKYIRYDVEADQADPGYPQSIAANWKGMGEFAKGIDAAFLQPNTGKVYFFKGSQYLRYDLTADQVDPGYPLPIIGYWPGLEAFGSVEAAFVRVQANLKVYFFKGDQYIRYDWKNDQADGGYPAPITGNWDKIIYPAGN